MMSYVEPVLCYGTHIYSIVFVEYSTHLSVSHLYNLEV
jgi:hypothetical protein